MAKFSKGGSPSKIQSALSQKSKEEAKGNFNVSFQYLDTSQKYGSSFKDWQECGLLSKMMETLQGYCCRPLREQFDGDKFAHYGGFPPQERTKFKCPANIPEDANWSRIHINNKSVVVGHYVGNTFYVVFLDKTHKFYLTARDVNKK